MQTNAADIRPPQGSRLRFDVSVDVAADLFAEPAKVAVEVLLPRSPAPPRALMVCLPGGGMNRRYFDLPTPAGEAEVSFAVALVARGYVVALVDPLGVGESTKPLDGHLLHPDLMARAHTAVLRYLLDGLRNGSLCAAVPASPNLRSVGVGHSVGALLTIVQQAAAPLHDALALFGFHTAGMAQHLSPEELAIAPADARVRLSELTRQRFPEPYLVVDPSPSQRRVSTACAFGTHSHDHFDDGHGTEHDRRGRGRSDRTDITRIRGFGSARTAPCDAGGLYGQQRRDPARAARNAAQSFHLSQPDGAIRAGRPLGGCAMKALVIGGGGPTGPFVVEGLRRRGYQVAVLNRGVHPALLPDEVERIVGDPHFIEPLRTALGNRTFEVVIANYGRLAVIAEALAGRTTRFIGVGGFVGYRGFFQPELNRPSGLPTPTPEEAPFITEQTVHRFAALVAAAETAVFRHHPDGTVFRYPYVYGPRQLVPREWSVVRRVLDGRRAVILVHGGLGLLTHAYAENIAHALMLAVDQPAAAAGKTYNCGDEVQLDQRQFVEVAADALGAKLEIISIPDIPSAKPASIFPVPHHLLMDTHRIRSDLGYRDVVPTVEAVTQTVRWYRDNPPERGGEIERRMSDVFDYGAEDKLIELYREFAAKVAAVTVTPADEAHPYAHPKKAGAARDHRGR